LEKQDLENGVRKTRLGKRDYENWIRKTGLGKRDSEKRVPWKLLKKARLATHKRVYVCTELTCLHHDLFLFVAKMAIICRKTWKKWAIL
jgi:hypothetical protein